MSDAISVKTAAPCDAALIASLAKEIWAQHYLPIIGQQQIDYMLNTYQSEDAIRHDISNGYLYYIAYLGDTPCGYSAIIVPQSCCVSVGTAVQPSNDVYLSKFYVRQTARGRGIGRTMLNEILSFAKDRGAGRIWLSCNKHNVISLAAYRKLGFDIISDVVTDIGGGFVMDDFVLEKKLDRNSVV